MLVYRTFGELKTFLSKQVEEGRSIGFVPTMGALHSGHISLVKKSIDYSDITVCSIFVNPTQFNVSSDLEKYPRTEKSDLKLLKENNCDVVFVPAVEEVYPKKYVYQHVDLEGIDLVMEGKHRPGHFNGVVQVVGRFFEEINPTYAFFGEKDFQQLAVISKMVQNRKLNVKIVSCEIIREDGGLAMSSRNIRLSPEGRKKASFISRQLSWANHHFGKMNAEEVVHSIKNEFSKIPEFELEYVEIANSVTLQPIQTMLEPARIFLAVELEGVRLIDNCAIN
ncbi:MAG: pantoate--beta-alanine ligase [Salibacteraceae bacterium]